MSKNYAEKCLREAIAQEGGNSAKAQKRVMAMIDADPSLLRALVDRHLEDIVAFHVDRVIRIAITGESLDEAENEADILKSLNINLSADDLKPQANKAPVNPQRKSEEKSSSKPAQKIKKPAGKEDSFGLQILRAIASGGGAQFGFETMGPVKPQKKRKLKASESHVKTMQNMSSSKQNGDKK